MKGANDMEKVSNRFRTVCNPGGPAISTVSRRLLEKDGLIFKDLDGSGEFKPFDDWRLPARERAEAFVRVLSLEEKLGQLFASDWHMARDAQDPDLLDGTGLLDEGPFVRKSIFGEVRLPGTHELLQKLWARHLIFRSNPEAQDMADFFYELHAVAEECAHFVPVQCISNSRNENGETVTRTSVARKMILTTISFALITLILSTVTFMSAIFFIRDDAVENSQQLGESEFDDGLGKNLFNYEL